MLDFLDINFLTGRVMPYLDRGLVMSLQLIIPSALIGGFIGVVMGVMRVFGTPWMRRGTDAVVAVIRGVPLTVQLMVLYFGLPSVPGLKIYLSPYAAALIGFFLHALALSGYEVQLSACAGCGAVLEGRCRFDAADGCFYCADCARGAGVSAVTVRTLQGCAAGETEPFPPEGKARAVKLLYAYLREKTGAAVKAVDEYLALLGAP